MRFVNRERELEFLEARWRARAAQLVIVYGRRRVGKTELLKRFCRHRQAIYYLADRRPAAAQLRDLGRIIGEQCHDRFLRERGFGNWLELFRYLQDKMRGRFVLAIDEYPYLAAADPSLTSLFQKGWDEHLTRSRGFLILCGSSVAVMETETLAYASPLYGRRTGQINLPALTFTDSRKLFPGLDYAACLNLFAVADGIPPYLLQFDPRADLETNLVKRLFPKTEFLHNEVEFLLREELREPKNYLSIITAIALGKAKFGEIANATGLGTNILMKYLHTLENLKLTVREVPVTEPKPHKSKKGIYKLTDNYFRFWFRYLLPRRSELELGKYEAVLREIRGSFNILLGQVYEEVCRQRLWELRDRIFPFDRVGRWWDRHGEIDLVALNEETGEILFGEAKWTKALLGLASLANLRKKAELVAWRRGHRRERYALFSKTGFTPELRRVARAQGVYLVRQDKLLPRTH